jgi:hypothetical protein
MGTLQRVGTLIKRLATDAKEVADDQIDLARAELVGNMKSVAITAGGIVLTGVIIAIAIGFLAVALVVAIEPLIASLSLRLVVTALVYLAICYGLITFFVKRFKDKVTGDMPQTLQEAKRTVDAVQEEIRHA